MNTSLTYTREVTAQGFLGRLRQRGLEIAYEPGSANVALLAYTPSGTSTAARLEVPTDDLRRFARLLLDIADATSGTNALRPARLDLGSMAALRRAG